MIVICHGMVKSASSFATQIAIQLLRATGKPIYSLKQYVPNSNGLYLDIHGDISQLLEEAETPTQDGYLVVKSHAEFDTKWLGSVEAANVKIISTYRDPAEIALSLIDAGEKDEQAGRTRFNAYKTIADTIPAIDWQIRCFASWVLHCPGVAPLYFDDLVLKPYETAQRISGILAIPFINQAVSDLIEAPQNMVWEFNKGVQARAKHEMLLSEYSALKARWSNFYSFISDRDIVHLRKYC